jgi:hypothetical protein
VCVCVFVCVCGGGGGMLCAEPVRATTTKTQAARNELKVSLELWAEQQELAVDALIEIVTCACWHTCARAVAASALNVHVGV